MIVNNGYFVVSVDLFNAMCILLCFITTFVVPVDFWGWCVIIVVLYTFMVNYGEASVRFVFFMIWWVAYAVVIVFHINIARDV